MKLLHCNGDLSIPIENSEVAFNHFVESGATDVYFEDGGNFGHTACAQIAIIGSKLWIDTMSDICQPQNLEINSLQKLTNRNLVGKYDLLGKKVVNTNLNNRVLIYIYDDGTYEKRNNFIENQFK